MTPIKNVFIRFIKKYQLIEILKVNKTRKNAIKNGFNDAIS